MMTTRKILMILAGLVLGAALTTYLMLLQADRRATAEARAGMDETVRPAAVDSRTSENHMTEGSIGQSTPPRAITKSGAVAQQPAISAPVPAPAPAPAAPAPMKPAPVPSAAVTQSTEPAKPAPSTAVASVNVQDAGAPKVVPAPAPRAQRGRESLDRRAATNQGPTPETEELVRESAKLDPSLPPPTSMPTQTPATASTDPRSTSRGAYQTGAAQTDQLVRDSAKLDPSLPPPNMSAVRAATEQQQRAMKPGAGSNPVAAAATDQLVRDSAKLDPSLPPPK
ncbi:hypothetical protein [Paraburkholderia caribensis]|nr:hypothetical protein [Paraburkholderia caribensis]